MKYLILAGGAGTRLWPLSRKFYPKQFLNLVDENSMLQNTALRVSKDNGKDIFVITNNNSYNIIKKQLSSIFGVYNIKNIILEPLAKNTGPAIAYSSLFFDSNDIIAVLSSDHHISNNTEFNNLLNEAEDIASQGYIVTLGIVPYLPKTGYGYIQKSETRIGRGYKVKRFVEKPDIKKAEEYVKSMDFFWNAGIFIFKVKNFLEELEIHSKDIYNTTINLKQKINNITKKDFDQYPNISIDYALMEKSDKIVVIPADIGWSDIGSFHSLYEISEKDCDNNVLKMDKDNFININSKNLLIYSDKRVISTIDATDLAIIDTEDSLLISKLESSEKVKDITKELEKRDKKEFYNTNKEFYEWGYIQKIEENDKYSVQKLFLNPVCNTEEILLKFNSKTVTVIRGNIIIEKNREKIELKDSESLIIKKGETHKIINNSNKYVELIQIIS